MTSEAQSVLLFFIDGLGIGARNSHNPLNGLEDAEPLAIFPGEEPPTYLDGIVVQTDACLGVDGRPQSASGQTTILTGINAPARLGYHKQGFPNAEMREIISQHSVFLQLSREEIGPLTFANAYTKWFFEERPRWVSATTAAVQAADLPFRTVADLNAGRAVYQDFTNAVLIQRGEDVRPRSVEEAADILGRLSAEHRFTLYEYFITDKIGHAQDMEAARLVLRRLAHLIRELLDRIDLHQTSVILTSDHGNIEDLSSRNHTLNAVPTIVWGANRDQIAKRIRDLADITPAIVDTLSL
ncbi:MAG TPA: alkaline phosphatase family protein [Pyrinomonadaceae bacterium]|nr:alkaline phosphatase family protein [Pyrinomonadaceae bacterium]